VTVVVRQFSLDLTCAFTPVGSPTFTTQTTAVGLGDVMLLTWRVLIPDGHAGLTGVALQVNGVNIVPFGNPNNPYIVGNNIERSFPVNIEVDQHLAVHQLNEDNINHTHYMVFEYTPIAAAGAAPVTTVGAVPIS
jgi:hypothetical protein